ncbi:MAG: DUF1232 domain-containing protein [Planctomycetota bacterium]|jgi:hypothetical protein|nr:DUF1232 domain-containing protein [Planctomycetota bacterium]
MDNPPAPDQTGEYIPSVPVEADEAASPSPYGAFPLPSAERDPVNQMDALLADPEIAGYIGGNAGNSRTGARARRGVAGFGDPLFWTALLCYGAGIPLFLGGSAIGDDFHILMPAFIAFIVVTTLAWDYRVIGEPGKLHVLILHIAFFVSLIFLLNRLMSISEIVPFARDTGGIQSLIVRWMPSIPFLGSLFAVFDFALKWLGFALILFMVSGAIIFPPRTATSLLFIAGALVVAISVGRNLNASVWTLFAGLVLLLAAFLIQRVDRHAARFWNQVAEKFSRSGPRPGMDMKIKIAILRELDARGALGANQIRGIVAGQLDQPSNSPALVSICDRITDQLVNHDRIVESRDGPRGWHCVLALPGEEPDFFSACARTVRVIVTLSFCVVYILSPVDFVPDAVPIFGVADDMVLGSIGLLAAVRTVYGSGREAGWPRRTPPFGD